MGSNMHSDSTIGVKRKLENASSRKYRLKDSTIVLEIRCYLYDVETFDRANTHLNPCWPNDRADPNNINLSC